jgi:hypothetical protein
MMGQQQQETVAAQQAGGALMRRIMLVVAVAAVMALVMAASAMPAMAKNSGTPGEGTPFFSGDGSPKAAHVVHCWVGGGGFEGTNAYNKNNTGGNGTC